MTIIDSSCWVEYYRADGEAAIQEAVASAIKGGDAATCGVIAVEILGFISRKAEFAMWQPEEGRCSSTRTSTS